MITDRRRLGADGERALIRRVALASRAGVHLVQIRERDLSDAGLLRLTARAVDAARSTRTRIIVNDRADVALAAGAHGVHLRADSVPARRVRAVAPVGFLVGRSVHTLEEADRAAGEGGLDYLLFGTVFETLSKPGPAPAGVAALRAAVSTAKTLPVLAVGGVGPDTVRLLPASGCAGFAAIGLFADGPEERLPDDVAAAVAAWENLG
jgi:thiamine-phosphate pyrophosphorylase